MRINEDEDREEIEKTEDEIIAQDDEKIESDSENINNTESLEKKKEEAKRFYAENNRAHTQSFIQEVNYTINNMSTVRCKLPVDRQFDLANAKECIEFVTEFKNTEYFFTAFILLIFQKVDVFDVRELKRLLLICLSDFYGDETEDMLGKSEYVGSYVALDSILSVINGEKYIQDGRNYLGFGKKRTQILKNFMEQYSDLQSLLLDMLLLILQERQYRSHFYVVQIAMLIKELWIEKIIDVEYRILPVLCKDESNIGLLSLMFSFIYENEDARTDANAVFNKWEKWERTWLWKIPCLVYIQMVENSECLYLKELVERIIEKKLISYNKRDYNFLSELMIVSKAFREGVSQALQRVYLHERKCNRSKKIAKAYLYLVEQCYYKVCEAYMCLPFVVCDSKEQLKRLEGILETIINERYLREQLFLILKVYLKELSYYNYSRSLEKRVAAFLCVFISKNDDYRDDVCEVIEECSNKIRADILKLVNG